VRDNETMTTSQFDIVVRAPAKVNLTLDVLGRRPDGYHALRSVMQTLALHDTLELRPAEEIHFWCDEPSLAGENNLVMRAARLMREASGHRGGAQIILRKVIPVDAGLGGGSSDAAATLAGLNQLWDLGLPREHLAELGARLGSDVPFFFYAPAALVEGRGEVVTPVPSPSRAHVVLLRPPTGVSTARIFAALSPDRYDDGSATDQLLEAQRRRLPAGRWPISNGLQSTVIDLYPEVAGAARRLRDAGAGNVCMTGSGSTVYAVFDAAEEAQHVYERVRNVPGRAFLTTTEFN
jgi:4-diphosphocytidyl-2-C-methyl-D-erythritol kinase